jgi:hypothetical protein
VPQPISRRKQSTSSAKVDVFLSDPKLRSAYLQARQGEIDNAYGAFFRKLGLPVFQIERLETLLLEQDRRLVDQAATNPEAAETLRQVWHGDGPMPEYFLHDRLRVGITAAASQGTDGGLAAILNETDSSFQATVVQAAGQDGWNQLQVFQGTLDLQPLVESLAANLSIGSNPLSTDQVQRLIGTLRSVQRRPSDIYTILKWPQILDATNSVLTPAQQQMFEWTNAEQIGRDQFHRMLAELQLGLPPATH